MLNPRSRRAGSIMVAIVATASVSMMPTTAARPQSAAAPCSQPLPPGFVSLDQSFWDGPWAFAVGGPTQGPLPALDNSTGQPANGPIRIRLDDGSGGTLRVESRACAPSEDCEPFDCGCPLEREDSYWIDVADGRGRAVARMHLWAAYGKFQIVPVDLIDGPGDELLIVRVPAHSSPPAGYDLKIWKIGRTKPVEIGASERVAKLLDSNPIGCARWRTLLSIDPAEAKPRAIALRTEFGSTPCCRIETEEANLAGMRRGQVLRFDSGRGKYVVR